MLKKLLSLSLVFLLLFSFSACGGVKGADAQIIYPIDKDPGYLDPQIIYETGARNIIANCFEGLVALDGEGNIVPAQAENYTVSSDGKVYTFNLRKDLKWKITTTAGGILGEDYKETFDTRVTAADFAFGITRALLPETKSPDALSLYPIKNAKAVHEGKKSPSKLGVKAVDDYTLKITLSYPDPDFLYTLTKACCMPCNEEFFEATGGRYGLSMKYIICNGPFYLHNWADDKSFILRRNTSYYDTDNVMPYSIYFSVNNEQSTRLKKLTSGTYNVSPLTESQAEELGEKKKYTAQSFESSMLSFVFNCGDTYLSNVNIRRALVSSINTTLLTEKFGESPSGILPDGLTVGGENYGDMRKDMTMYTNASPLTLFKNGLAELEETSVSVSVICSQENENTVRNLMQSWQSVLGVQLNITVEVLDEVTLESRIKAKNYQLALADITFNDSTAYSALSLFTSYSKENFTAYSSSVYDGLVLDAGKVSNEKAKAERLRKAEENLILNCVIYPVKAKTTFCGLGKGVSGVIFNRTGETVYFKNALEK